MLQATAVPLSSAAGGGASGGMPIPVQGGPTLLERFYAIHRILDASQRLSWRLELREAPPEQLERGTRAVVPVIFPPGQSADVPPAAEEQQAFYPPRAQQAVGSGGGGQGVEDAFSLKEKKSKAEVEGATIRRMSHKQKGDEKQRAAVATRSGAFAERIEGVEWDTHWYDRELRRNLKKERELAASKVRLIEEAWIEHMRSKRQVEQYQRASECVVERRHRNARMQRLAAGLQLDASVSAAFEAARGDSLLHAQRETQGPAKRRSSNQVTHAADAAVAAAAGAAGTAAAAAAAIAGVATAAASAETAAAAVAGADAASPPTACKLVLLEVLLPNVPDVQFKPPASLSVSEKSSKGQHWWQRVEKVEAAIYWELLLDLKVQALSSRLNTPNADRQLAAEAAALAKKLREAQAAPHKPFDASASKIIVPSPTANSPGAHLHAEGHSPADGAHASSPSGKADVDVCDDKSSREVPSSSSGRGSTDSASPPGVDAKAAELAAGVCRKSLRSGYEATPADVIAFRASALAVRSLGPHRVRPGLKDERRVKGSARRGSLKDAASEERQMKYQEAAGQKENLRSMNVPLPKTEQILAVKDGFTSCAARQPVHAYALPDTQETMEGEHDVADNDTLEEALETRSAEAEKLRHRAARSRFQRHQQQMAASMKQAGFEGRGHLRPRHQRSDSALRLGDGAELAQQAHSAAGVRLNWHAGASRGSSKAGLSSASSFEEPTDDSAREWRPHATEQKQADEVGSPSLDADLPVIMVHRHASGVRAAAPTAGDLAEASEAAARSKQLLLTVSEKEMAQKEKRLSERRWAAASWRSSPTQQTPQAEAAEAAAEDGLGEAGVPSRGVGLEAVRQALLTSREAEDEAVQPPQVLTPGAQEERFLADVTSPTDATAREHRLVEGRAEALIHVLARQKEMAAEAGERAAAQRAKKLRELRSAASSRLQTPRGETSDEASARREVSSSNAGYGGAVSQALSSDKGAEGEVARPAQPPLAGLKGAAPSEDAVGTTDMAEESKYEQAVARDRVRSRQKALGVEAGELASVQRAKRLEERRSAAATRRASVQQTPRRVTDGEETTAGAELHSGAVDLEAVSQALLKDRGADSEVDAPPAQPAPFSVRQEAAAFEDVSHKPEPAEASTHPRVATDHADVASANVLFRQGDLLSALRERGAAQREKRPSERRSEAATRLQTPQGVPTDERSRTGELSFDAANLGAVSRGMLEDEDAEAEQSHPLVVMPPSTSEAGKEGGSGSADTAAGSGSSGQIDAEERHEAARAQLRACQKDLASTLGKLGAARREKMLSERRSQAATRLHTPRGGPAVAGSAEAALSAGAIDTQAVSQAWLEDQDTEAEASQGVKDMLPIRDGAQSAGEDGGGAAAPAAGSGVREKPASDAGGDAALAQLRGRQKELAFTVGKLAAAQREKWLSERRSGASTRHHTPRLPLRVGREQTKSGTVDLEAVKKAFESDRGFEIEKVPSLRSLPHEEDEAVQDDVRGAAKSAGDLNEQDLLGGHLAETERAHLLARQKAMFVGVEERAAAQRAKRLSERRSAASSKLQTPRLEASGEASPKSELSPSGALDVEAVSQALLVDKAAEGEVSPPAGSNKGAAAGNGGRNAVRQQAGDDREAKVTSDAPSAVAARQLEVKADDEEQGFGLSSTQRLVRSASRDNQFQFGNEHSDSEGSPSAGSQTFRPRPAPHAVDLSAVSEALLRQKSSSGSLVKERDCEALYRPSRTPVWGRARPSKPISGEGSLASPGSPIGNPALSPLSALQEKSVEPATKALQRLHRLEAHEGDWVRHQEALIFAMHRHAAARVIQHAWRRKRLASLFHAVLEMTRRRERSASQSRRSPNVATFSDRARDIISRCNQLSFRLDLEEPITAFGKVRGDEDAHHPQFVPIVDDRDDTSTAVVLFKGKRAEFESKRRASDNVPTQQASSREPKRSSSDSFPHISDTESQGSGKSERLPAIVLRRASRGPLVSSESSSESAGSSSESESEDEDTAADSNRGTRGFIDSHEDDFDMQQRLRRIVREGLDAKMRSTVEGSSVLLPRSRRSRQDASISSISSGQDHAFREESSKGDEKGRMLPAGREKRSSIHSGHKSPLGPTEKKRAEQGSRVQKTARSSGTERSSGFLSPGWQAGNAERREQRQSVSLEVTPGRLGKALASGHQDRPPLGGEPGQQVGQARGGEELRTGGVESDTRFAEGERKPGQLHGRKTEGGDATKEAAHALQKPDRKAAKDEGCHKCQGEGQCFCGMSAKDAVCEDKANLADALPRSPRKRSPREFGGPPALVR
ncbi:hypothetical protein ACSSS7_001140 [Eimeria intestinalis]